MPETNSAAAHLSWCKRRAIALIDKGDLIKAQTSLMGDLFKREDTARLVTREAIVDGLNAESDAQVLRDWVDAFQVLPEALKRRHAA